VAAAAAASIKRKATPVRCALAVGTPTGMVTARDSVRAVTAVPAITTATVLRKASVPVDRAAVAKSADVAWLI
jgi:hypothetical protein